MKLRTKEFIDFFAGNILILINIIPARLLGLVLRRDHSLKKTPDCIIITKLLGLGSLLMAADAILAIKKKYPSAKLVLVCSASIASEVINLSLFDEVWALDDSSFLKMIFSFSGILVRSWKIRNKWTVNIEVYSRLSTLFSLWTFARNRFGFYFNEVKFRHLLNTSHVYFNQMALAYSNYSEMAKALNAVVGDVFIIPAINKPPGATFERKFIAINNNCSELAKERLIPISTIVQVIAELLNKYDCDIALIGSKADYSANEELLHDRGLSGYENRILNIAGKYSFGDFLAILKQNCLLMLTVDSAPVHIAYRLQLPTVSVWGPTHPMTRIPDDFIHEKIYLHAPCSPCVHHTNILPCGGDNFCMKNIKAAEIVLAVKKYIAK